MVVTSCAGSHKVFQVWEADVDEHILKGTEIRVDATIFLSQQSKDGRHYLVAQIEYFGGTTGPKEIHFQQSTTNLGPCVDKLSVSIRPEIADTDLGPAIASGYEQKARGSEITESASASVAKGVTLPITFMGGGVTPSCERICGSDVGIKIAGAYEFDRVTSRDPMVCEMQLRLTSCANGIYQMDSQSLSKMLKLPENYGAGISISIENELPTIRWVVTKPFVCGKLVKVSVKLDGTFAGVYQQSVVHVRHPFALYHHKLTTVEDIIAWKV